MRTDGADVHQKDALSPPPKTDPQTHRLHQKVRLDQHIVLRALGLVTYALFRFHVWKHKLPDNPLPLMREGGQVQGGVMKWGGGGGRRDDTRGSISLVRSRPLWYPEEG